MWVLKLLERRVNIILTYFFKLTMQKRHKDSLSLRFYPYKMLTCPLLMNGSLWTTLKWFQGLFGLALTALVVSPVSSAPASTFNAFSPFNDATNQVNRSRMDPESKTEPTLSKAKQVVYSGCQPGKTELVVASKKSNNRGACTFHSLYIYIYMCILQPLIV